MENNVLRMERHRRRREENKLYILKAAESVFAEKGYSLASMDAIALQAGFSKATLYKYFKSKKEIFLDIITSTTAEFEKKLESIGSSGDTASERLREYLRFNMGFYHSKENLFRIFYLEKHTLLKLFNMDIKDFSHVPTEHPPLPKAIEKSMFRISAFRDKIIREGIESGEFRPVDVSTASFVLGALIRGFHFRGPQPGPVFSLEESVDIILDYFLQGITKAEQEMGNKGD
jgi:AcrR family transcriptional regulator